MGNGGVVKVELNGSDLGLAGVSGEVARIDFDLNGSTQS